MNSWIEKNIQITNDRIALKTFNKSYTFNDVHKIIFSYIDNLKTIIKPNEAVGFLSEEISEYAIFSNAVPMAKGIFVPLNPNTTKDEISKRLSQINCKKIIFTKKNTLLNKLNNKEFDLIQVEKSSYKKNIKTFWPKKNDIHSILFTSGTSRIPKPVELSINNIEANCYMSQKNLKVSNADIWLLCMPPFHAGGLSIIFRSMILGTSFYVENNFNSERVVELIQNGEISIVSLVPTMLLKVLDSIALSKQIIHDKFKFILCGGFGTRLDYEGKLKAKPMIKIGNKPILIYIIENFIIQGFDEFVFCLGHKSETITNYFLRDCGQRLFHPPSIAGWPIGEEWLVGDELVNRVLLPAAFLKIANRSVKRSSYIYKLFSRLKHRHLRRIRYTSDCNFDEINFSETLENCGIEPRSWMNNYKIISNKLSDIIIHPKHQYS